MTNRFRLDIQALRALAVMLVLVFHAWPNALPAGYVGVDVFFVISGYLITGLLYRELAHQGRIDFARFYIRRFRRLMPAASVVILVTMLLSFLLEPAFRQPDTAMEGLASALYWQNWLLASRATDYLAAENVLGPLTHFWSLSIEEQFYLFWPLALLGAGLVARSRGWGLRPIAITVIAALSLASLASSFWLARANDPAAYFVTHTRIWELGLGALVALIPNPAVRQGAARWISAVALIVIIASACLIPKSAAFPGVIALAPTLATAVFIVAGAGLGSGAFRGVLASRPVQLVGDASYSIYLWHWPLLYFATLGQTQAPGLGQGLVLVAVSIVIGWSSRLWIEEPFRYRRGGSGFGKRSALAATMAGLLVSVGGAWLVYSHARTQIDAWADFAPGSDYPGGLVLLEAAAEPPLREPVPPLVALKDDIPVVYERGCHVGRRAAEPEVCVLEQGDEGAPKVVLVGDSHAANWVPAMRGASAQQGWTLISITKSACAPTRDPGVPIGPVAESCVAWTGATLERVRELKPDLVVIGRSRRGGDFLANRSEGWSKGLVSSLTSILEELASASRHVAIFADTPRMPFDPATCLAQQPSCDAELAETDDPPDALVEAAGQVPGVLVLDLRAMVCPAGRCPAVIGNVVVWRDNHHLTSTYSRSLAPVIVRKIGDRL